MVAVNTVGFVALVVSLLALHPRCRKKLNGKQKRKSGKRTKSAASESSKLNTTKVVPVDESDESDLRTWGGLAGKEANTK